VQIWAELERICEASCEQDGSAGSCDPRLVQFARAIAPERAQTVSVNDALPAHGRRMVLFGACDHRGLWPLRSTLVPKTVTVCKTNITSATLYDSVHLRMWISDASGRQYRF
jgi:hypothetical protein